MLDENQTNTGLTSDEGQASGGEGGTSAKAPRTYTEKEYSDALANAGRQAVERAKADMQTQIDALQSQLDEKELAAIGDNPEAKSKFQLNREKSALEKRIKELENDAAKGRKYEQLQEAQKIAAGYENIDPEDLVGKTTEDAEAFCKKYGKPKGEQPVEPKPDSGVNSGGGKSPQTARELINAGLRKMNK